MGEGVLKRYREYLPVTVDTPMLSMGEGDTPLVESRRLGKEFGIGHLFFKLEGCNPTGSFKDRGMVVAVAKALEAGHTTILCASTGNTSASAAAYGAAAGLETVVLVPAGQIAEGKLRPLLMVRVSSRSLATSTPLWTSPASLLRATTYHWLIPSTRTGLRARKRPHSRLSKSSAMPRITYSSPWATPAISPPIGKGSKKQTPTNGHLACRE